MFLPKSSQNRLIPLRKTDIKIRSVILSGGCGTRLWPISRVKAPKQFVPLVGKENLFTATLRSAAHVTPSAAPMIVGNNAHKFLIRDALEETGINPETVFLEPTGRNTAAAILLAALAEQDPDALHLVRPSDHIIADSAALTAALAKALPAASAGYIVLFGITPNDPETGYGYITPGNPTAFPDVAEIESFKEKPDFKTAEALIASGALWNSGMFLYSPKSLLEEAEKIAHARLEQLRQIANAAQNDGREKTLDANLYAALPSEPFDRVIMEHTTRGAVIPCAMGWSDVGSWQALWQSGEKDAAGNLSLGPVLALDTANSYIRSEGPAIAVLGMRDVAVVASKDAVLVVPRARAQEVKTLVAALEQTTPRLAQEHPHARRPWGCFESLTGGKQFQVKHITVAPGRSLSLQMHRHRAEHWIVVEGTALAECGDEQKMVFSNESLYIPKGAKHRLSNPGVIDLHLIEVQTGDYLGEDDIVRFADAYGRVNEGGT
ncbi:MAG: mannose-1-phosphate guanylyltransferase/mannose-6-phosphate isomerase [Alphaproteobacteria bacterium]|nr:mannose-1-phosphate guanylyltransferase/mannose-6-phosphate isomerase [Alphaproteobacteria bacterium]